MTCLSRASRDQSFRIRACALDAKRPRSGWLARALHDAPCANCRRDRCVRRGDRRSPTSCSACRTTRISAWRMMRASQPDDRPDVLRCCARNGLGATRKVRDRQVRPYVCHDAPSADHRRDRCVRRGDRRSPTCREARRIPIIAPMVACPRPELNLRATKCKPRPGLTCHAIRRGPGFLLSQE